MGDLTEHFSLSEFQDPTPYRTAWPHPALLDLLERVRAVTGQPLRIVSGSRTFSHNRAVGGAADSQHVPGLAADIPPGHLTSAQADQLGVPGAGIDSNGWVVHVDVGPPGRRWNY